MPSMVASATWTATIASISTPVRAVHSTVARHSTRAAASSSEKSTATEVSGTGWHRGINSEVRFAAWMPATRATPKTSPFFEFPSRTRAKVAGSMRIAPPATATRWVSALPATSTIRAAPRSSKWVSFSAIIRMLAVHSGRPALRFRAPFALLLALHLAATPVAAQSLPDLGDVSAATLTETQERTIGKAIMREARVDPAFVDDPEIADYVSSIGNRLLGGVEGGRRDIDFFAVQDD